MTVRSVARELAVIVLPQLPKENEKLESTELSALIAKAVSVLCDYAKQSLCDANGLLLQAAAGLEDIEIEHPINSEMVQDLAPVPVTTDQLRQQLELIERALHLVSEALDVPELALYSGTAAVNVVCKSCQSATEHRLDVVPPSEVKEFLHRLVTTYVEHRSEIDEFIRQARAKWKVERMVSIDRDILRLACAEALFMSDIPVNVCISEAVELTHRFADERAAKFVNGILGDLASSAVSYRKTGLLSNPAIGELPSDVKQ